MRITRVGSVLMRSPPWVMVRVFTDAGLGGFYQGAVVSAIGGVEMALWDLAGQAAGVPIWQLFGGRMRERVPLYATGHNDVPRKRSAWAHGR